MREFQGRIRMAIVDLIEAGLGLVLSESDITPQWAEGVLRGSGSLEDGVSVTGVSVQRIGEGVGILSILQRVTPTYSGDTKKGPKSFIVKYPTNDATQRFTADALAFYARELLFYKDCAADAPFRTAKCFGQAMASDSTDFTIAMEDIGHFRPMNQLEGVGLDEAKVLLQTLADFHAMWLGSPKLAQYESVFQPIDNPTFNAVLPMLWTNGWPFVEQHAGHLIPDSVREIGELWAGKLPWMLQSLSAPTSMIHGDFRADNIMFDGSNPAVIDFQLIGTGSVIYDVGYFISQSIATEVRRGHDRELVDVYVDRLEKHGIDIDREEIWHKYLVCICLCVTYGVTTFAGFTEQNERGQKLLQDMLLRALQCVADNNALEVLRS